MTTLLKKTAKIEEYKSKSDSHLYKTSSRGGNTALTVCGNPGLSENSINTIK